MNCVNREKEKAVLLEKELKAVPFLTSASDSLLCELETLSAHQQARILLNLSSIERVEHKEVELQEKLLLKVLPIASEEDRKKILQRLIAIYKRLNQLGFLNATSKGISKCEELEDNYVLSNNEDCDVKRLKAFFLNTQGSYKESISILYQLLNDHRKENQDLDALQDIYTIATYFIRLGDLEKGLSLFNEAYAYSIKMDLREQQFICLSSIIDVLFDLKRYNDIVDICSVVDSDSIVKYIPSIYTVLSKSYLLLQKTDSARFYLSQVSKKMQDSSGMVQLCRMAETYILENRVDSAEYYLNKAVESWKTVDASWEQRYKKLPLYFMYVYPSYASLLQKNGKVKQAGEAFQFVEPLMRTSVSEPERLEKQIDALGRYSDFCRFTKQYEKAAELLVYRDSIQKLYYENKISLDSKHWVDRFEIQELTYKTEKQQEEINNAKRMLAIIIVASVIVLCISSFAFYMYKRYKKQNEELRNLKMQEIMAAQLANSQPVLPKKREPLTPQERMYNAAKKLVESKKLFLNSKLSLDELAKKLDTNRSTLSLCINQCSKCNFNQWINNYRIEYAQKIITANTDLSKFHTEVGFNSCSTFYNSFKERLGCTPNEYINEHKYDNLQEEVDEPIA